MHLLSGLVISGSIPLNFPNWEQHWFSQVLFSLLATSAHEIYHVLFSSTSYGIFRRTCICKSIHRRVLQGEKIKKDWEAAGEIKHTWETRNCQAFVARTVSWLDSPCYKYEQIFTWISVSTSLLTGECQSWDVGVLWYSWDSSPSFIFGSNLPLDPKCGSLQVYQNNHEQRTKEENLTNN